MKKNLRVVQINGFTGLILALIIVSCLIAGFIAFPAFVIMNGWNYLSANTGSFPPINFGEGVLLWAIITFSLFIFNKKKFIVSFNAKQELTEEEVQNVLSKIKSQTLSNQILIPKDMQKEVSKEFNIDKEDLQEVHSDSTDN